MKYSDVLRWQGTTVGRRGTEYETFKTIKADKLLAALEEDFPGIRNNIENYWTSTPLTYQDYTATKEGSTYGVLRDVTSPMQTFISQRTKIPNLFLTGQNTNSHGILGVIISAIITAGELVGRNTLINELKIFTDFFVIFLSLPIQTDLLKNVLFFIYLHKISKNEM